MKEFNHAEHHLRKKITEVVATLGSIDRDLLREIDRKTLFTTAVSYSEGLDDQPGYRVKITVEKILKDEPAYYDVDTQDPKYSIRVYGETAKLINKATGIPIPDVVPVMMFLGKDHYAVDAIEHYAESLQNPDHLEAVRQRLHAFKQFAKDHADLMKEPDTTLPEGFQPSLEI